MKYCSKQHENPDDAVFCSECGERLTQPVVKPKVVICPKCSKENPHDAQFCYNCGFNIVVNKEFDDDIDDDIDTITPPSSTDSWWGWIAMILIAGFVIACGIGILKEIWGLLKLLLLIFD